MANLRSFGGAIWTNHALSRLDQRGLTQKLAWEAFQFPDKTVAGKQPETVEYQKRQGGSRVTVIAKQNERKEWLILSAWVEPPLPGSVDIRSRDWQRQYEKSSFWRKFWMEVKRQISRT